VPYLDKLYAGGFALILVAVALLAGFRRNRSPEGSIAALVVLLVVFLVLLTPHYPWYYLIAVPFLAVYPWSWTLWVITVASVLAYNEIPNDKSLPPYIYLMMVFNALVFVALVRDFRLIRATPVLFPEGALRP
jgi:CDP-diglyceride synthetase